MHQDRDLACWSNVKQRWVQLVRDEIVNVIRRVDEVWDAVEVDLSCRPEESRAVISGYAS